MMDRSEKIEIGQVFGRWTVVGAAEASPSGRARVLCRCECGTERLVLERSLRYGLSQSCGCAQKERIQQSRALELTGKTFGELTVLHRAENQRDYGGIWWTCRCACGETYDTTATLLQTGKRTRCSSSVHKKGYLHADITGQRFHRLVALEPTGERNERYSVIWRCRCDCGRVVELPYNSLLYGNIKSCGCQKKEYVKTLPENLTHVAGTSLEILKSQKIPTNNTTGAKGVYLIRGKWVAKIVFQKKAYYLGTYDNFEDAAAARREAESIINRGTVDYYTRWKARAEADPIWGAENPVEIRVERDGNRELKITFLPELD